MIQGFGVFVDHINYLTGPIGNDTKLLQFSGHCIYFMFLFDESLSQGLGYKIYHKKMPEYLLPIRIEHLEEGGYLATSDDFPELLAQGRMVAETLEII